jgi:prepilin-type N-terminal cleavage/methylation domain-containing protein
MNGSRVFWNTKPRRGFTLLELVVSVAVASVLVVGLSASVVLAMRAGDSSIGPFSSSHSGAQAVLELTRDLQDAISVNDSNCTATSVEFTVPDRTGDSVDETIRYSWSGTAGDPLLRTMNGMAEVIAANITSLEFAHLTRTATAAAVRTESAESLLIDQNSSNTGVALWHGVTSTAWVGETITPTLPADAVDWKITKAQLTLGQNSTADGAVKVQLRTITSSYLPTTVILDEVAVDESSMTGGWKDIVWTNADELPLAGVAIVVAYTSGSATVANVRKGFSSLLSPKTRLVLSSNGGASFGSNTSEDLWLKVWGTYTTMSVPQGATTSYRTGVDISLQVGSDSRSRIRTAVHLPNEPEVGP